MPDTVEQKFLQLFKNAVKPGMEKPVSIESKDECVSLLRMSLKHHLSAVVYESARTVENLPEEAGPVLEFWRKDAMRRILSQTQRTHRFIQVYNRLSAAGVEPLVMKGLVCRVMYRNPDARWSADEDILIPADQFAVCDGILREGGFAPEDKDSDPYDPEYEVSYLHPSGLRLELHRAPFPEDNAAFSRLNHEFSGVWETSETVRADGFSVRTFGFTENFFYLLCHNYKHFIVNGFGIRQLYDMLILAECRGDCIDWNVVLSLSKKYGMERFLAALIRIGEEYLDFDRKKSRCPDFPDESPDVENLLSDILEGGSYGKSSMARIHSANITLSAVEDGSRSLRGSGISLARSLFPPVKYMKKEYPYLKKHGWLLPAAWTQRAFRYLKRTRLAKRSGAEPVDSVAAGRKRVELLRQYGILRDFGVK